MTEYHRGGAKYDGRCECCGKPTLSAHAVTCVKCSSYARCTCRVIYWCSCMGVSYTAAHRQHQSTCRDVGKAAAAAQAALF